MFLSSYRPHVDVLIVSSNQNTLPRFIKHYGENFISEHFRLSELVGRFSVIDEAFKLREDRGQSLRILGGCSLLTDFPDRNPSIIRSRNQILSFLPNNPLDTGDIIGMLQFFILGFKNDGLVDVQVPESDLRVFVPCGYQAAVR